MNKKCKAFSFAEVFIAICLMACVAAVMMQVVSTVMVNLDVVRLRKADNTITQVVDNLLNEHVHYAATKNFRNPVSEIGERLDDGSTFREDFRSLFSGWQLYDGNCRYFDGQDVQNFEGNGQNAVCFVSKDSLVWCVPDTDWSGKMIATAAHGGTNYLPITVYLSQTDARRSFDRESMDYAVFFAVRRDGDLRVLDPDLTFANDGWKGVLNLSKDGPHQAKQYMALKYYEGDFSVIKKDKKKEEDKK